MKNYVRRTIYVLGLPIIMWPFLGIMFVDWMENEDPFGCWKWYFEKITR